MKHGIVWPGAPPVKAPGLLFFRDFLEGHLIRQRLTAVPVLHASAWKIRRIQPHRLCLVHWSWMLQSFSGPVVTLCI